MTKESPSQKPVLIIGATGMIGSRAVKALRTLQPDLPLALAAKDLKLAEEMAADIGNATAVTVDLARADLGLSVTATFSAMAIFLKDDGLNSLAFAQARGIPYMDISSAAFEIGPEVARYIQNPTAVPVLMNSNWLAGTSTALALHFAKSFQTIDSITISALLDEQDIGGKAAAIDYDRQTGAVISALALVDGKWRWLADEEKIGSFKGIDGSEITSQAFSNLDVLSLASATTARNVKFEFAVGQTAARKQGKHFSHEIIITIRGERDKGESGIFRYTVVHPEGQAPMTALSAALAIERLADLRGQGAVKPGLYLPHVLLDIDYVVRRLASGGAVIKQVRQRV